MVNSYFHIFWDVIAGVNMNGGKIPKISKLEK